MGLKSLYAENQDADLETCEVHMGIKGKSSRITAMMIAIVMLFSCVSVQAAGASITITNYTAPDTLQIGHTFALKGKIKSTIKIKTVVVGVVKKSTGKWTDQKYTYKAGLIKKKTFNVKKADSSIRFGKLKTGAYYYRIRVTTTDGKTKTVLNHEFKVEDKQSIKIDQSGKSAGIKLKGCRGPGNYKVGKEFTPVGSIESEKKISKVEVGIVLDATNKWTTYKYTANVNAYTFNLSDAASKLKFDKLPGGDFRYRMYAHTSSGAYIVFDRKFTVKPSDKPQKAVKWAKKIAADDSFTYGKKPIANAIGCYFCNTNDRKVANGKKAKVKGYKRYEKTYVCLTFIGAAYAHGAKDPEILDKCQRRKMTMYETDDNFKVFSCWMKIGACRDLTVDDLQVGDVIIKWSDHNDNNGHVCMYIGGNDIVESSGGGWDENSIAVKKDVAASRLASLGKNSKKNYVMRYIK